MNHFTSCPEVLDLISFLKFPSISTSSQNRQDIEDCALWLQRKLESFSLDCQLHETPGNPILIARNQHIKGKLNVLIYGHYDVQPVDPLSLWNSPPFEPRIEGEKIYARGSSDNKGQLLSHVLGIQKILEEKGELPVNLTFLFEGEEEIGSPNLPDFLKNYRKDLDFDIALVSDTGLFSKELPAFSYSLRGIACCEIFVQGAKKDLHSGIYGGIIANPITQISHLIASLHNEEGGIQIPGFYDDVISIENWEKEIWKKIPGFSEGCIQEQTGVPQVWGEKNYSILERLWARPTVELNGISGGYQGEGTKTVIPSVASAKISFRLVPNQKAEDILKKTENYFNQELPDTVDFSFVSGHSGNPYLCDPRGKFGKVASLALKEVFGNPPILIREGGSIPIIEHFKEILGVETLLLGLALPDANIHSANETFNLNIFKKGIEMNKKLMEKLGELSKHRN